MRVTRVFTQQDLEANATLELEEDATRHLIQVLRIKVGDLISLFNGNGYNYPAKVISTNKKTCLVEINRPSEKEPTAHLLCHLGVGISRGERMDYVVQKSVELGINEITPLFTQRTNVKLSGERLAKRMQHWQGIIHSACEQSGRCYIPKLHNAVSLSAWLEQHPRNGILLDHRSEHSLPSLTPPKEKLHLLVGPEGGLSENERNQAKQLKFVGVRMGPRIMRTETAPLAALAAIQALWGDFR